MNDETAGAANRKREHLRIVLEEPVSAIGVTTGFERCRLVHCALPEIDLAAVDTGTMFLGRHLQAPILISGMTGGVAQGAEINRRLATGAQACDCAMGVGSQRVAIEDPALARFFRVRDVAPDILLFANLGAVQLNYGYGLSECRRAVEMIGADALALHLNPLQEALQTDGNTNWSGLLRAIEAICAGLGAPVLVKEVGWGISSPVAQQLRDVGVAAIDVGGAGGTSWSAVERERTSTASRRRLCDAFAGWGMPTMDSLLAVKGAVPELPIIASGGLRSGVDAAKAITLGADLAGFAAPLLRAAAGSDTGAQDALAATIDELRLAMFCCGAGDLPHLRQADRVIANAAGNV